MTDVHARITRVKEYTGHKSRALTLVSKVQ